MKILLAGACGRMGRAVSSLAAAKGDEVVAGVDTGKAAFPVYPSFKEVKESADVIIDFSSPSLLPDLLAYAEKKKLPTVLATTGYSEEDIRKIGESAKVVPIFRTGNLSVGVNVLQALVKRAARALDGFDVEIVERHHNQKKDAPSGTALMLAESVKEGAATPLEPVYGRQGVTGARRETEIGIHAVRGGTIVGEHEVMFAGEDETVSLIHRAQSRNVFAAGALRAAHFLIGMPPRLYDMDDLLGGLFS